jgi:hypothetical protein
MTHSLDTERVRAMGMGYMEAMNGYEVTPDGLLRRAGRAQGQIAPLDEGYPIRPSIIPEMARHDDEAAQRFNKVAQIPATTQLTVQPI